MRAFDFLYKMPQTHSGAALFLVVACLALFLPGFFSLPPTDRDESRFAQATKQMVMSGDYINIRLQDVARNKKPAGIHWLQAAVVKLSMLGEKAPIWVYRIPSLLGAIAAVLFTYWALLPLMRREEAFLAALLLSSCVLLGIEAKLAKTDAVLLAATTAAMGALVRVFLQRAQRWTAYGFWLALVAGALVKGPIILLVTGGAALALSFYKGSAKWMRDLKPVSGFALFVLLVAPWTIAIFIETQGAFFQGSMGQDLFGKVVSAQETHGAPPGTYLALVWLTFFSASCFLAAVVPRLKQSWRQENVFILLAWIAPGWLVFELIPTKLPHYVLPVYPALAGLVIALLSQLDWRLTTRWQRFCMALFIWVPPVLLIAAVDWLWWREGQIDFVALILAPIVGYIGWLAFRHSRTDARRAVVLSVVSAALLSFGIFERIVPHWQEIWLSPRLAEAIQKNTPCENPGLASASYHEPSLVFLTRTDILLTNGEGAAGFLAAGGCRLALIDEVQDADAFQTRLRQKGARAKRLTVVDGRNVNGGKLRRMGLWVLEK